MADFPTLGLRFDVNEVLGGLSGLTKVRDAYLEVAAAREKAQGAGVGGASGAASGAELQAAQAQIAALNRKVEVIEKVVAAYQQMGAAAAKAEQQTVAAAAAAANETVALSEAANAKRVGAVKAMADQILAAERNLLAGRNEMLSMQVSAFRDITASMIAIDRQRVAAAAETEAQINAVKAEANAFALSNFQATTASMIALGRQREAALIEQTTAAYAAAERQARTTNTPFSVIATQKTIDPIGDAAYAEAVGLNKEVDALIEKMTKLEVANKAISNGEAAWLQYRASVLGVSGAIDPMVEKLRTVENGLGRTGGTAFRVREALVSLREIMRGDFSRLAGTLTLEAQAFGLLQFAMTPVGAALTALIVTTLSYAAAVAKMDAEQDKLNNTLAVTNNAVGQTAESMVALGEKIGQSTNYAVSATISVLTKLAATGEVSAESLALVGEASIRLSQLTGESADKISTGLVKSFDDASKGAVELNNHYHFLTLAQYEAIEAAEKAGDKQKAFNLLMEDFNGRLKTIAPDMGFFAEQWHEITQMIDGAVRALGDFGKAAPAAMKIAKDQAVVARFGSLSAAQQNDPQEIAKRDAAEADAKALELQTRIQNTFAKNQADAAARNKRSIDTHNYLERLLPTIGGSDTRAAEEIANFEAQVRGGDPNDPFVKDAKANMARYEAAIRKKYDRADTTHGNTFGVQNQLARLQAQQAGLFQQALNPATDPISAMLEQIKTAGAQAAGGAEFGKRSAFQEQLADAAQEVERLKLVKQVNTELSKRVETQKVAADEEAASFAAYKEGAAAQSAYYKSGQTSLESQIALQQQLIDIQERAKEKADALKIIQQTVGVTDPTTGAAITTVDQAYSRLLALAGGNKEVADAMRDRMQAAIDTSTATDRQTASDDKAKAALDPLVAAQKAYNDELTALDRLQKQAGLATADQRAAQALVTEEGIYRVKQEYQAQGVALTNSEAANIERANQLLIVQAQYWANLQIQIKDAMEQTFIDTGKLDFKGLQDGMTKALRKAIYDSLIAKPIDIIVNAEVNLLNQFTASFLQPLSDKLFGGFSSILSQGAGGAFDNASGAYNATARQTMNNLVDATTGLKNTTSHLGNLLGKGGQSGFLGAAGSVLGGFAIGQAIGNPLAQALGINQGAGALAGGGLGAIAGFVLGGPIGSAVGAVLGDLLGGLFDNKPTNGAGFAKITPTSFTTFSDSKTTQQGAQLAQAFSQAVVNSEQVLKQAGVTLKEYVSGIDIGTRDVPMVTFSDGHKERLGAVGDAAAAADAAMKELLQGATYADAAEKKLADSMIAAGASFDDIAKKLQEFGQAADFLKGVDRSILKLQDPQAGALADLRDQQIARRQQAITYYQDGVLTADQLTALQTKLKTLEKLEIVQTLQQFSSATVDATATVQEFADAQKKVIDYANGLLVGNLSPLSPMDQLSQAQSSFYSLLSQAQGGSKNALDQITGASDTYLNQAHAVYASSTGYASIFDQVEAALRSLGGQAYPTVGTTATTPDSQAVVAALAQLQDAITQNNADLITAISPATNDNATGADIANQTQTLVGALQDVQTTIAASTEAITYAVNGQAVTTPLNLNQLLAGGAL